MRFNPSIPFMVLLSATGLGGCASQNATDMLPREMKLAMAADAVRESMPAADAPAEALPQAQPPAPATDREALSPVEIEFRRQQQRLMPSAPGGPAGLETGDPVALFNRAREMQAVRAMADPSGMPVATAGNALAPSPQETWNAALARAQGLAPARQAEPDTAIVTAAVDAPPDQDDILEFVLPDDGTGLPDDAVMQIRLKTLGGRKVRRIVVGRIEGKGFEVLARAQEIARAVAEVTGGEPGMSYDPAMSTGAVRLEYEPFRGTGG
ncbi:MAG: hypothetical protein CMJ42_01570 [Phyllobacteriaceae bacterium]|nr:hypothetical protein [Phyllobacteriaceae bacterium]MBA90478.1 hypothetical protein [Phyllobacteriaceae bacterium]